MRSPTRRFVALQYGLWFALVWGAPQLVHPCPEHTASPTGARPAPTDGTGATHATGQAHHAHGQPAGGSATMAEDQSRAPSPTESGCCCPGPQCGAGAMALPLPATFFHSPVSIVGSLTQSWRAEVPGSRPDYFIPFGTAPPAASLA